MPDLFSFSMKGRWQLTPNQTWQIAPEKLSINWDAKFVAAQPRHCRSFGTTPDACLHGFMSYMHRLANKCVTFSVAELATVGAPVLLSPDGHNPILLSDNAFNHKFPWFRSKIGDKKPFSFFIRDAYIVHPNIHTLLPLVMRADPQLGRRQLIIVDSLPDPDETQEPQNIVLIRSMVYLRSCVTSRKRLKAPNIRVFVLASVVAELQSLIGNDMPASGRVAHKYVRTSLYLCTILSDLPWDRVITCTTQPIRLPPGHRIGFWWTLCNAEQNVFAHAAPLSHVTFSSCKLAERTIRLLNRSRMIDLSFVPDAVVVKSRDFPEEAKLPLSDACLAVEGSQTTSSCPCNADPEPIMIDLLDA